MERFNFICIGDRVLSRDEKEVLLEGVFRSFRELDPQPDRLMLLDCAEMKQTFFSMERKKETFELKLNENLILTFYFSVKHKFYTGMQNIGFSIEKKLHIINLSIDSRIIYNNLISVNEIASCFCNAMLKFYKVSALAYGPELDLYEISDVDDIAQVEKYFLRDQRCNGTIVVNSVKFKR